MLHIKLYFHKTLLCLDSVESVIVVGFCAHTQNILKIQKNLIKIKELKKIPFTMCLYNVIKKQFVVRNN